MTARHTVAHGEDPALHKQTLRHAPTVEIIAQQYLDLYAKVHKKSWRSDARLLAKEVFPRMLATGDAPAVIMEREGLKQISDTGALELVIEEVIAQNPKQVEQFLGGKTTVINFLVGQAMRATRGQANVGVVTEILKRKLGSGEKC